ncbi:MAG: hypothetical protein DI563_12020 [Variovorax paradoxus]|uniref:Type VI secretion system tube protein Hcp n=1 Tax=Variovorax paradoxus TaxID=34073 RepID=A0A2W5QI96_VARPD|nr:MAG: hypothetical protein DI563_12020 [Variovorax paradoxus]
MSLYSIDNLLQLTRLAHTNQMGADLVMAMENSGTPVTGDNVRRYPDGKPRLDMVGMSWGLASATIGGAAQGPRSYAPLTVVRQADSASAILTQLTNNRAANLRATISKYLAGGDASVTADTLPMFELKIDEAQITAQYFITAPGDVMLYEILVFSYRKIEIKTAPQQGTGSRGATRECQIIVASMS